MSEVVGPHVIEQTDEVIHVRDHRNGFYGEVPKWECKYCGATGRHPDDGGSGIFMPWDDDCEGFEMLESEREALAGGRR